MNLFNPEKTVNLTLVGLNGNAFNLMGAFQRQARKEGWSTEEIKQVLDKCMSGDYDELLCTLMDHCEDYGDSSEWEDED
jgi:hypothetical protein